MRDQNMNRRSLTLFAIAALLTGCNFLKPKAEKVESKEKSIETVERVGDKLHYMAVYVDSYKYSQYDTNIPVLYCAYFAKTEVIYKGNTRASSLEHLYKAATSGSPAGEFVVLEPDNAIELIPFEAVDLRNTLYKAGKTIGKDSAWNAIINQVGLVFDAFAAGAVAAKQVLEIRDPKEKSFLDMNMAAVQNEAAQTAKKRDAGQIIKFANAAANSELNREVPAELVNATRDLSDTESRKDAFRLLTYAFKNTPRNDKAYQIRCRTQNEMADLFKLLMEVPQ
jgi:hypothetical protein